MKKIILSIILALLVIATFSACESNSQAENTTNVTIGVIETTGYKSKSYIHFFDEDLKFLYKEEFDYASLSEPFDRPVCENGEVYIIPKGEFEKREETYILKYNIKSDEYKLYNTHIASMNRLAISKEFVFGVNCINGTSNLVRCSKKSAEGITAKEFKSIYIAEMFVLHEKLYVIMHTEDAKIIFAELSIETLEIVEQYDITSYGSPCNLIDYEGKIYFSNQYEDEILGTLSSSLTVFDVNKKTFKQIELNEYSSNNLVVKDEQLFVSHYDRVQNQGNKISVVDIKSNVVETYDFEHPIKQISTADEYFYVLGDNSIYKYSYEDSQFKLIKKMDISVDNSDTFYYITSFFINQ